MENVFTIKAEFPEFKGLIKKIKPIIPCALRVYGLRFWKLNTVTLIELAVYHEFPREFRL